MTGTDGLRGRMSGDYQPPILAEPVGGPIPGSPDDEPDGGVSSVNAAAGDESAQRLQQQWEQAKAEMLAGWPRTAQPMVDELAAQAEQAVDDGDVGALGELAVSAAVIAAAAVVLGGAGTELSALAAAGVVAEAAVQGVTIAAPVAAGAATVQQTAHAVAGIIASGYAAGAARAALLLAGANPAEVRKAVGQQLTDLGSSKNGLVGDNIAFLLSAAQHAGRLAVLQQHPAKAYRAIEASDGPNRCKPCGDVSGHEYPTLAAALKDYPVSGFRACLGRSRCRGHLAPIF